MFTSSIIISEAQLQSRELPPLSLTNPATYWSNNASASCTSMTTPQTLQPAIQLPESKQLPPPMPRSHSPTRRALKSSRRVASAPRHQRHSSRPGCPIQSPPHPFDQLPWISMLDSPPDHTDLSDIADLSLLPVEESASEVASDGPGPIRRRRTSLRSNSPDGLLDELRALSPRFHASSPSTPPRPRRYSPVRFRNLMPVFSCDPYNSPALSL